MTETFMTAEDHFAALVASLDDPTKTLYDQCRHNRIETGYRKRHFIVYHVVDRAPVELDRITVRDFNCDDEYGATVEISSKTKGSMLIDYVPQQLFDYPVFMWLPLHAKTRWSAPASDPFNGSLGFPVVIRTKSRFHLREKNVTYCEAGPAFGAEFGNAYGS